MKIITTATAHMRLARLGTFGCFWNDLGPVRPIHDAMLAMEPWSEPWTLN